MLPFQGGPFLMAKHRQHEQTNIGRNAPRLSQHSRANFTLSFARAANHRRFY